MFARRSVQRYVGPVVDIPGESSLPRICPTCDADWMMHGTSCDPCEVILGCKNWHQQRLVVSAEEALSFQLLNDSDKLLERPVSVLDGDDDIPEFFRLPGSLARVGVRMSMNDRDYVVDSIDEDRVWLRLL